MKSYLEGEKYYISGELSAVRQSIAFLEKLKNCLLDEEKKSKCDEVLKQWKEARIV